MPLIFDDLPKVVPERYRELIPYGKDYIVLVYYPEGNNEDLCDTCYFLQNQFCPCDCVFNRDANLFNYVKFSNEFVSKCKLK